MRVRTCTITYMTTATDTIRTYRNYTIVKHHQFGRWMQQLIHYEIHDASGAFVSSAQTLRNAKIVIDEMLDGTTSNFAAVRAELLRKMNEGNN